MNNDKYIYIYIQHNSIIKIKLIKINIYPPIRV